MYSALSLSVLLPVLASATHLWVSSYDGTVTTLSLTQNKSAYSLTKTSATRDCLYSPSWLIFNSSTRALYCIGEGLTTTYGGIAAFQAQKDGSLITKSQTVTVTGGGVSAVEYSIPSGSNFIALAHYGGSAVTTWSLPNLTTPKLYQTLPFTLPPPGHGPNQARQDAPHQHQVILDPTGKFILSPDLGGDVIRVFSIDATNGQLNACPSLAIAPGSGPRHAVFRTRQSHVKALYQQEDGQPCSPKPELVPMKPASIALYVVSELVNTVTAFNVTYPTKGCLAFEEIQVENTFGNKTVPTDSAVAEIHIAGNDIYLSNRNDKSFPSAVPNANASDSLATYSLQSNNEFQFRQLSTAGGSGPRQFSISKAGDLVAVGLQKSFKVAIITRNVKTGTLGDVVAEIDNLGEVTCVVWDE